MTLILAQADPSVAQGLDGIDFRDSPVFASNYFQLRAEGLIEAINTDDRAATEQFLENHATVNYQMQRSVAARADEFALAKWRMGSLTLRGERTWTTRSDTRFFALAKEEASGMWWQLDVRVVPDEEHRISSFTFSPVTAPQFEQESSITSEQLSDEVARSITPLCIQDRFSGTLLIARMDNVLATLSCGEAGKSFGTPNRLDTRFNLGSMNKMFTALAIMQLVEQGEMSLDDTLSTFLDDAWVRTDFARIATIEQLLAHRSGFGNYQSSPQFRDRQNAFVAVEDYKPIIVGEQPIFQPGEGFRYSNSGFVVLGAVIESVTGESYFAEIRDRIYELVGMPRTDSYAFDEILLDTAESYVPAPERSARFAKSMFFARSGRGTPAGGGYSTVVDLHRFGVALLARQLVSQESLNRMWRDLSGSNTNFYGYGLGFEVRSGTLGLAVGHNGNAPGVSTNFEVFPEAGHIIVVLSNYSNTAVPVARRLSDLVSRVEN